jgi:hypothetical protein
MKMRKLRKSRKNICVLTGAIFFSFFCYTINPSFRGHEMANNDEIPVQYSKMTRLNKSIQDVISIGKVSWLYGEGNLSNDGLSEIKSTTDQSYIENRLNDGYIPRKISGKAINGASWFNIIQADNKVIMNTVVIDSKVPTKLSKLNHGYAGNHIHE